MPRPPDPNEIFARLEEVERARLAMIRRLEELGVAIDEVRDMRRRGESMPEILTKGPVPAARKAVRAAWLELNTMLHAYRAEVVRVIVDEDHWTIAGLARAMGTARQVVSRLYWHSAAQARRGHSNNGSGEGRPP